MYLVKYPFKVKVDQTYYQPNTLIKVAEADEHVKRGAVIVEQTVAVPTPKKPAAKRQRKAADE